MKVLIIHLCQANLCMRESYPSTMENHFHNLLTCNLEFDVQEKEENVMSINSFPSDGVSPQ